MSTPILVQDFFELGDKTALVCGEPGVVEGTWKTLKELGHKIHFTNDIDDAIERIRYTQYNCVIVQEELLGKSLEENEVMQYLATQPMSQRRNTFVALIGDSCRTLDAIQAFSLSVHVVINPSDLPNLTAILKKSIAEYERNYRIYRIVLDAARGERRAVPRQETQA
jgi:hypothetical protein